MENKFELLKKEIAEGKEIIKFSQFMNNHENELASKGFSKSEEFERIFLDFFQNTLELKIEEKILEEKADKLDWNFVIRLPQFPYSFSEEFIEKFSKEIPWDSIFYHRRDLTPEFYIKYKKNIDWYKSEELKCFSFTEDQARQIAELTNDITNLVNHNEYSEEFLLEFRKKILWSRYNKFHERSLDFLKNFVEYINFENILRSYNLTEDFLDFFKDKINWFQLSDNYYLSDRLRNKYSEQILNSFKNYNNIKLNSLLQELEYYELRKKEIYFKEIVVGEMPRQERAYEPLPEMPRQEQIYVGREAPVNEIVYNERPMMG